SQGGVPVWIWLAGGAGVLFLLLIVGGVVLALILRSGGQSFLGQPAITQEALKSVQNCMTPAEVKAILGRPTQEVNTGAMAAFFPKPKDAPGFDVNSMRIMVWTDHATYTAAVYFVNDQVFAAIWNDGPPDAGGMPSGGMGWGTDGRSDAKRRLDEQQW